MSMIMFYVTFETKEAAEELSNSLLKKKMIACSNIHPITSSYHWQGAIESSDEWAATMKTSYANKDLVEFTIQELHPYEVPCIIHWEFSCNLAYEKWLRKNIKERL